MPKPRLGRDPRQESDEESKATEGDEGGEGDSKREWMNGRAVFKRPESRVSTVARRDIILNEREREQLSEAYVRATRRRQSLNAVELEDELKRMQKLREEELRKATGSKRKK